MKASIWIKEIKFKNFDLTLKKNAIVVFVGSNNAGKSRTLQELRHFIYDGKKVDGLIIDSVQLELYGKVDDFFQHLEGRYKNSNYHYINDGNHSQGVNSDQIRNAYERFKQPSGIYSDAHLLGFFVKQLNTVERLSLVNPPENIDFISQSPNHPIHILQEDDRKEEEFSKYFKLAFGQDIVVNHGAGKIVPLHVGKKPTATKEFDRVSTSYQKQLRLLGKLNEQGDGMKSFAGVFLGLFAEDYSINIVDEPEAFLHPPQAALLGQMIARDLGEDKQIFIATHSEHMLKGLLDNAADRLVIIRIQRDGNDSQIKILENKEVNNIWSDSLLRHSNVLDGLFHKRVILCESDSDCRFYSSFVTTIIEQDGLTAPDILFVQSGGKHRFPVVIKALKKLDVPLTVVGDFDFYHNENPIRMIYTDMGGDWDEIKDDFKKIKQAIDQKRPELETKGLKNAIDQIFSTIDDQVIPEEKIKHIQNELKKSSPWAQAKSIGKSYLPAGESINAFNRVQIKLKQKGIIVLEIGEIEAFDKTIGGHGPKWVANVLEKDLLNDPELDLARKFVKSNLLDQGKLTSP